MMSDLDSSPMSWGEINLNDNINNIISSLDCEDGLPEEEEDELPATQPLDQRILKDVVVFVDVRTGADNRSAAVALQLEKLGAQVERKLTKNVTHVVFKDGRKNTLQYALKRKLKLVTVLWVDSCRLNQEHVSEGLFPVASSGENLTPMFGRLKKMKSMQPKDFDDELRNSTDRAKKTLKRRENKMRQLAWRNLFTDDSQPDDNQLPMISTEVPATPPNMLAKYEQMKKEREERESLAKRFGIDSIDESDYSETDLRLSLDPSPDADVEYDINLTVGDSPPTEPHSSPEDIFSQDEHKSQEASTLSASEDVFGPSTSNQEEENKKVPVKKKRKLFSSQDDGNPPSFLFTPKRQIESPQIDANNNGTVTQQRIEISASNVSISEVGRQVLMHIGLDDDTPVVPGSKGKGEGRKRKRTVTSEKGKACTTSSQEQEAKTIENVSNKGKRRSIVRNSRNNSDDKDDDTGSEITAEKGFDNVSKSSRRRSAVKLFQNDSVTVSENVSSVEKHVSIGKGKSTLGKQMNDKDISQGPPKVKMGDAVSQKGRRKSLVRISEVGNDAACTDAAVVMPEYVPLAEKGKRGRRKSELLGHAIVEKEGCLIANEVIGNATAEIEGNSVVPEVGIDGVVKKGRRKSMVRTSQKDLSNANVNTATVSEDVSITEKGCNAETLATPEVKRSTRRKSVISPGNDCNDSEATTAESFLRKKQARRKSSVGAANLNQSSPVTDIGKTKVSRRKSTFGTVITVLNNAPVDTVIPLGRNRRKSAIAALRILGQDVDSEETEASRRASVEENDRTLQIDQQSDNVVPTKRGRRKSTSVTVVEKSPKEIADDDAQTKKSRRKSTIGTPRENIDINQSKEKSVKGRRKSTLGNIKENSDLESVSSKEGSGNEHPVRSRRKSMVRTPKETVRSKSPLTKTPSPAEKTPTNKRLRILSSTNTKSDKDVMPSPRANSNSRANAQNHSATKRTFNRMSIDEFSVSPRVHRLFKGQRLGKKTPSGSISTAFGDDSSDGEPSVTPVPIKLTGKGIRKNLQKSAKVNTNTKSKQKELQGKGNSFNATPVNQTGKLLGNKRQNASLPAGKGKSNNVTADNQLTGKKTIKRAKSCSSLKEVPRPAPLYSDVLGTRKASATAKNMPSIVTTSLHYGEQDVIQSVIENLGGFRLVEKVDLTTTHIICGKNRRTLNILHAITGGCWILSPEWVYKSLDFDGWIEEEPYQQTEFFPACQITRLQKFVEGPKYRLSLFQDIGTVYVGDGCAPPADALIGLIKSCGGKVTTNIRSADVIVGKSRKNVPSVSEKWILDSITELKCQPFDEYRLNVSDVSLNGANNSKEW